MKNWFLATLVLLVVALGNTALAQDKSWCNVTWDDYYIYAAINVDSDNIRAVHSQPNAPVGNDDSVTLYIDSSGAAPDKVGATSFAMTVSPAGGAQFFTGSADGKLAAKSVFTFKYGTDVKGTLNSDTDKDRGYTVEIALPWALLETKTPAVNAKMAFNVVIRKDNAFESLSEQVKDSADLLAPTKWSQIEFVKNTMPDYSADRNRLIASQFGTKAPLIDGNAGKNEWPEQYAALFSGESKALPTEPEIPAEEPIQPAETPVEPVETTEPPSEPVQPSEEPAQTVGEPSSPVVEETPPTPIVSSLFPKLVMTPYFYWFQADTQRGLPVENLSDNGEKYAGSNGGNTGLGPWFTYDRVQWHLEQVERIIDTGVDILLPVYRGDKVSKAGFARKGLDTLVSALNQLSLDNQPLPRVGLFLDTSSLKAVYGDNPDLKEEEVRSTLYGMIKDFFERIPHHYRAVVQTRKDGTQGVGNLVYLEGVKELQNFDAEAMDYCSTRFYQDFHNNLVWIAEDNIAGDFNVNVANVGTDWNSASLVNPDWILCDTWNAFNRSFETSFDNTAASAALNKIKQEISAFKGTREFDADYQYINLPKYIQPNQFNIARVTLKNRGTKPWDAAGGYAISYRWYKDGRFYADSGIKVPLRKAVVPGESITLDFGIAPVDMRKDEIPAGEAAIRLELVRTSDNKWFTDLGDDALMLPVIVGTGKELEMSMVKDFTPSLASTGTKYKAFVSVRNEGSQTWQAKSSRLVGKLYKISNYTYDSPNTVLEPTEMKEISVPLSHDCTSGMIATFEPEVALVTKDGKALPEWNQSENWSYAILWDIDANGTSVSQANETRFASTISIFGENIGVWFVDANVPGTLKAGQKTKIGAVVRNSSQKQWNKNSCALIAKWFTADGAEVQEQEYKIAPKNNIPAGQFALIEGEIQAPEAGGSYILRFDFSVDGKYSSKMRVNGKKDIALKQVQIVN